MAYVHLPDSPMAGGISKIIGKLQGKISAGALKQTSEIADKLRVSGCPTTNQLNRLKNKSESLNSSVSKINRRLDKFRKIPKKLKGPVKALKVVIKVIKALPIPQSVPPGFGLPINLTVKYSDTLVLLQEFIQQIDEIIVSIETALEVPSSSLNGINSILARTDSAITSCLVSANLQDAINNGDISLDELSDAGLVDDDGIVIFSTLGPLFIGNSDINNDGGISESKRLATQQEIDSGATDPNSKNYKPGLLVAGTGTGTNGKFNETDLYGPSGDLNKAINTLSQGFEKLQDSNVDSNIKDGIRKLLSSLGNLSGTGTIGIWGSDIGYKVGDIVSRDSVNWKCNTDHTSTETGIAGPPPSGKYWDRFFGATADDAGTDEENTYTAANGITYKLEIRQDPNSPSIAPKRFGVALTLDEGVAVLKGQPSFSSDINVLLDEVKFRLDNQLP